MTILYDATDDDHGASRRPELDHTSGPLPVPPESISGLQSGFIAASPTRGHDGMLTASTSQSASPSASAPASPSPSPRQNSAPPAPSVPSAPMPASPPSLTVSQQVCPGQPEEVLWSQEPTTPQNIEQEAETVLESSRQQQRRRRRSSLLWTGVKLEDAPSKEKEAVLNSKGSKLSFRGPSRSTGESRQRQQPQQPREQSQNNVEVSSPTVAGQSNNEIFVRQMGDIEQPSHGGEGTPDANSSNTARNPRNDQAAARVMEAFRVAPPVYARPVDPSSSTRRPSTATNASSTATANSLGRQKGSAFHSSALRCRPLRCIGVTFLMGTVLLVGTLIAQQQRRNDASIEGTTTDPDATTNAPFPSPNVLASSSPTELALSTSSPSTKVEVPSSSPSSSMHPTVDTNIINSKKLIRDAMLTLLPSSTLYNNTLDSGLLPFDTPLTPQYCALDWLRSTSTVPPTSQISLLEQYALLVLFFAQQEQGEETSVCYEIPSTNFLGISPTEDVCSWNGGLFGTPPCNENGRRHALRVAFGDVRGDVPTELVFLQYLDQIILNENRDLSTISWDLVANWPNMAHFDLKENNFGGTFPAQLFSPPTQPEDDQVLPSLVSFSVAGNQLSGTFPHVLDERLNNLYELGLEDQNGHVKIGGTLPSTIDKLSSLQFLRVGGNALNGTLPLELGKLKLLDLSFYGNNFSGSIPTELGKIKPMIFFRGSDNSLTGAIPTELGLLKHLTYLELAENKLNGVIPMELAKPSSKLARLDLSSNELTGTIPPEMANLTKLMKVDFSGNSLRGPLPPGISKWKRMTTLNVASNMLTGTIPTELAMLKKLDLLDLSDNEFSGQVPVGITELKKLKTLKLTKNRLSGNMDEFCDSKLGGLTVIVDCPAENNDSNGDDDPVLRCSCCECE